MNLKEENQKLRARNQELGSRLGNTENRATSYSNRLTKAEEELKNLRHNRLKDFCTIEALQLSLRLMQLEIRRLQKQTNQTNYKFNEETKSWDKVEDNLTLGI